MRDCWISTSLFSEKHNWPLLLKEGIRPLLFQLPVASFRLRFNYLNGSNIQMALRSSKDCCEDIAKKTDVHFNHFFTDRRLDKQPLNLPVQSLFIPYPQNSIQYGLYELDLNLEEERNGLHQLLSEIILDSLQNDSDDTSILTLALYLHLTLIKVLDNLSDSNSQKSKAYFLKKYPLHQKDNKQSRKFFRENKNILIEIINDVFTRDFEDDEELFWLKRWEQFCEKEIIKKEKTIDEFFQIFATTIDNLLGLTFEAKQLFNDIMLKTIHLKWSLVAERIVA